MKPSSLSRSRAGLSFRAKDPKSSKAKKKKTGKKSGSKKSSRVTGARETVKKKTPKKASRVTVKKTSRISSSATTKTGSAKTSKPRRSSRLVTSLLALSPLEREQHFDSIQEEELIKLFSQSFPSDLVNLFLGLKPSTCRRLFEVLINHRKKAYLDTITLYYHKSYLINPFPLDLRGTDGHQLPNYYAILGLSRDATEWEIDTAAKLLLKAYQSDSFPPGDRKLGDTRRGEIKESFTHLRTLKFREVADRKLPANNYYYPRRDQSWMEAMQRFMP